MVMSELTRGGRLAGLLVFLSSWTKGPYIDPDQQGDITLLNSILSSYDLTVVVSSNRNSFGGRHGHYTFTLIFCGGNR